MGHSAHILCTRPLDDALIRQAAEKGVVIDVLPFIQTTPIRDEGITERVRSLAAQPVAAAFTSTHAVEGVAEMLGSLRTERWKIYCIGGATRQCVERYFGTSSSESPIAGTSLPESSVGETTPSAPSMARTSSSTATSQGTSSSPSPIAGTSPSASTLADVILTHAPAEIFFFCGDLRREELPGKLSAGGIRVNELVVYRTTETPHKVETTYDGIAFFSPSAVHSYFSANTPPATAVLFAIGQTTADAIRKYCSNPVIASPSPEQAALVRQIIDHFQKNI